MEAWMVRASSWMWCLAATLALSLSGSTMASAEEETREGPLPRFEACETNITEAKEYLRYMEETQREELAARKERGAPSWRLDELRGRFAALDAITSVHILEKSEMCRVHYDEAKRRVKARLEGCKARVAH